MASPAAAAYFNSSPTTHSQPLSSRSHTFQPHAPTYSTLGSQTSRTTYTTPSTGITPRYHHQKSSFSTARFRPAEWEGALESEAKVEQDLASWRQGWATGNKGRGRRRGGSANRDNESHSPVTNAKRYEEDNPYIRSPFYLRPPEDELDILATNGVKVKDLLPSGVAFPLPASSVGRSQSTQTESWGEYASALARIKELARQVKHVARVNQELEAKVAEYEAAISFDEKGNITMRNHAELQQALFQKHHELQLLMAQYQTLKQTRDTSSETTSKLQLKVQTQSEKLTRLDSVLTALMLDKTDLEAKLSSESSTRQQLETECQTWRKEDRERRERAEHEANLERERQQSYDTMREQLAGMTKNYESCQRLLDEHVRQTTLDAQHLNHLKTTTELKLSEKDILIGQQEAELQELRKLTADAKEQATNPMHPTNQAISQTLEQARANVAILEQHNQELTTVLKDRDKMINDLLTSSDYRREVLIKKEKAIPPDVRARQQQEAEEAARNKKKSAVCAIM